jgi:hypothetical protein
MYILCIGDIAISSDLPSPWLPPGDFTPGDDAKILFNWELPIGKMVNPTHRTSGPRLLSYRPSVNIIPKWAPGFAALATNHILDGGEDGLADTITTLQQAGFSTVGAGPTVEEIRKPLIWETSQGRLAIVNWVFPETHPDWNAVPGPNCWPGVEAARQIIRDLKGKSDWVMVFAHWSDELFPYPRPEDRTIARELAQVGVDVIVGHHPHVVRGMENLGTCPVFYSLGNFYFSNFKDDTGMWITRQAPRNKEGLGVELIFTRGSKPQYHLHSYWQTKQGFIVDQFNRAARRAAYVSRPLSKFTNRNYSTWYSKQRFIFDKWGYRLHFRLWQQGISGLIHFLAKMPHITL